MKIDPVQMSLRESVSRVAPSSTPVRGEKGAVPSQAVDSSLQERASKRIELKPFLKAREEGIPLRREDLEKLVLKPEKVPPEERLKQMLSADDIKRLVYLGSPYGVAEKEKGPHMILDPGMILDKKG